MCGVAVLQPPALKPSPLAHKDTILAAACILWVRTRTGHCGCRSVRACCGPRRCNHLQPGRWSRCPGCIPAVPWTRARRRGTVPGPRPPGCRRGSGRLQRGPPRCEQACHCVLLGAPCPGLGLLCARVHVCACAGGACLPLGTGCTVCVCVCCRGFVRGLVREQACPRVPCTPRPTPAWGSWATPLMGFSGRRSR